MREPRQSFWSARNPLGIIGLFIFLIYAISGLLLGSSISQLTVQNQNILVVFIVLFPIAVLIVFARLVTKHHMKLYGPSDFREDDSFLKTLGPHEFLQKKKMEVAANSSDAKTNKEGGQTSKSTSDNSSLARLVLQNTYGSYLVLESLVFQAIEAEYGTAIRRAVRVGEQIVDGLIERKLDYIIVEITRVNNLTYHRRARELPVFLGKVRHSLQSQGKPISIIVALVVQDDVNRQQVIDTFSSNLGAITSELRKDESVSFKTFSVGELVGSRPSNS